VDINYRQGIQVTGNRERERDMVEIREEAGDTGNKEGIWWISTTGRGYR
jgi:hypothetical protein